MSERTADRAPAPRGSGLITAGETMGLVTATGIGPLEYARGFRLGIGGAESNVAIGVARLGSPATWFGRVGSDAVGDLVTRRLRAEGVRTLATRDPSFTGLMVKHRRSTGGWHVDYHRAGSAGSRLRPEDVPVDEIAQAAVLHFSGITAALGDRAREAVHVAVDAAKAAGVTVSFDVNHRAKLWGPDAARPVLRSLVERADIVFAGVEEAGLVLGDRAPGTAAGLAAALAGLGPRQAVVKDGARGCTAVVDGEAFVFPAPTVEVVDPVGAGDAFVAGYLADYLVGADAPSRLHTAIRAGAFAVTVPGDCEGLAWRRDIEAMESAQDVTR